MMDQQQPPILRNKKKQFGFKHAEQRRTVLIRLLAMLPPWRKWILANYVLILLSSFLSVFSLVTIFPILHITFNPEGKVKHKFKTPGAQVEPMPTGAAFGNIPLPGMGDESTRDTHATKPSKPERAHPSLSHVIKTARASYKHGREQFMNWMTARARTDPYGTIYWVCLIFVLITLLRLVLDYLASVCVVHVETEFSRALSYKLYLHFLYHDLAFFHRNSTGALMNRIYNDIVKLRECIGLIYGVRIRQPIILFFLTIMLFSIHPVMAACALLGAPLLLVPTGLIAQKIRRISRGETGVDASVMELMQERLSGIRLIKCFGAEKNEAENFRLANNDMFSRRRRRGLLTNLSDPITESFVTLGIIVVVLFGLQMVLRWHLVEGDTYLWFLVVLSRFYKPLKDLTAINVNIQRPLMSASVIFNLLDQQPTVVDAPDAVAFPATWRKILFERVSFRYGQKKNHPMVLKRVNLRINCKESLAIMGHNGSGKSTLTSLLCRFYDPEFGRVTVDGLDLRQISRESLRRTIGVVTQDAILFNLTLAENIAFGVPRGEIDRERVAWAARQSGAAAFIESFKEGYETLAGPSGTRLSGGQRQLIALARIFYHDFPIVIYDEPTTHLDAKAEAAVMDIIAALMKNRTVILITHNIDHVHPFDRVILMRHGEIVLDTTPAQLDPEQIKMPQPTA